MNSKRLSREPTSPLVSTSTSISSTLDCLDDDEYFSSDALFPNCNHLRFVDKLSETKFPVYLVSSKTTDTLHAIKLFYWENDQPSQSYYRELSFAGVAHSNVIRVIDYKDDQELFGNEFDEVKVSYILMEYAKHGDLCNLLVRRRVSLDETLVRTYFHQLVAGLEALHSNGAAHLDLKLENLLISEDFTLKLADFDLSYVPDDEMVTSRGTKNYRAPEIRQNRCSDPYAADIYSAAIILFLMKTGGRLPFTEATGLGSLNLAELKEANQKLFWKKECEMLERDESFFSEEFKELFMKMTKPNPKDRATLAEVKSSRWYNREIYSQQQAAELMNQKLCL